MEFLTTEHVAEQAKLGEIPTLECSLKHHREGRDVPYDEFISAVIAKEYHVKGEFCACCLRFKNLTSSKCADEQENVCPLFDESNYGHHCCNGAWKQLREAFIVFKADMSYANFKAFQEAEGKVCTYIEGVLERKRAEAKIDNSDKFCWDCKHTGLQNTKAPCCDCMIRSRPKWQPKESKPALTYSIGDRFKNGSGRKWILANVNGKIVHIGLHNGDFWNTPVDVKSFNDKISTQDYDKLNSTNDFTRYWDSQKEELLDDLAQRAEDLDYFEICDGVEYDTTFDVKIKGDDIVIRSRQDKHSTAFVATFDKAEQFHQKLGQLIAAAKRKQKSK